MSDVNYRHFLTQQPFAGPGDGAVDTAAPSRGTHAGQSTTGLLAAVAVRDGGGEMAPARPDHRVSQAKAVEHYDVEANGGGL